MPAENCTGQGRLLAAKPELNMTASQYKGKYLCGPS